VQKFSHAAKGLDCNPWPNVNRPDLRNGRFKTGDFDGIKGTDFAVFDVWTSQDFSP